MAATVNTNAQTAAAMSPRTASGEGLGSPRLPPPTRNSSPPWNQVVRGPEVTPPVPSPVTAAAAAFEEISVPETLQESSEIGSGNGLKKPVWNKPSNGAPDSGPVMGAASWPSLFESTKASPKPPSADSLKNPSDAPVSAPQVASVTAFPSPASPPPPPQRQITSNPNNPNANATPHHGRPARQKSMKREGGGNSSSNGGFLNQPPQSSSVGVLGEASHDSNSSTKAGSGGGDISRRDHGHNNAYREGGQRGGGDHPQQRNYRRSNSGPHLRGDGSFGGRRDQDRANQDWNHHRSFNGRESAVPPQRVGPRGFIRPPPPGAAPYIPPPIRPYGNPMGIPPEMQSLYFLAPQPGMPFVPQMPPAVYFPPPDPQLHDKIITQIDYYFSNENLIRDTYLRRNMDEHGWVPVQLIAGFKKVMQLTTDVQLILDALRASTIVEIQGDKLRKRDDWMRWIMPPSVQFPIASAPQSPIIPGQDVLSTHVQGLAIDEKSANQSKSTGQVDVHPGIVLRASSGDMNVHMETSKDGRSPKSAKESDRLLRSMFSGTY